MARFETVHSTVKYTPAPPEDENSTTVSSIDAAKSTDVTQKQKRWRDASCLYRENRKLDVYMETLKKDRLRSAKWRSSRSEEDRENLRRHIRKLKAVRIRQETKDERFWRLLRRKDKRKTGYPNTSFSFAIERARGSGVFRGLQEDKLVDPDQQLPRSEEKVNVRNEFREEFEKFYNMLEAVRNGSVEWQCVPKSFDEYFNDRYISMTSYFIKEYLKDENEWQDS